MGDNNNRVEELENQEVKNCWEFLECPEDSRSECAAYNYNSGNECWLIAGSSRHQEKCPGIKNGDIYC